MKNLIIILAMGLGPSLAYCQLVSNGSFENWQQVNYYEEPESFSTSNALAYYALGQVNVTKTTDAHSGNYAARLECIGSSFDFYPGGLYLGDPNSMGMLGGTPYTEKPTAMRLWVKYNMQIGDSAFIYIVFRQLGIPIGYGMLNLGGQQNIYQQVVAPIMWFGVGNPDTVGLMIMSTNLNMNISGSLLYVDDISLVGATTQLPNNGLENWTMLSAQDPLAWTTSNEITMSISGPSATKSTDAYQGNFSLKLESALDVFGEVTGYAINGRIDTNGIGGGVAVSQTPEKFSFYYKYFPVGQDSAEAAGILYMYDAVNQQNVFLEQLFVTLPPASTWTYHEVPFTYTGPIQPDSAVVAFASSNLDGNIQSVGSILFVDKVELVMTIGIETNEGKEANFTISPNPSHGIISLQLSENLAGKPGEISVMDVCGRLISCDRLTSLQPAMSLDFSTLPEGLYFLRISGSDFSWSGKFLRD